MEPNVAAVTVGSDDAADHESTAAGEVLVEEELLVEEISIDGMCGVY